MPFGHRSGLRCACPCPIENIPFGWSDSLSLLLWFGFFIVGLRNKGAKTIEAELELALYLAGTISKDNFGNPRKVSWSRSGRTDKGVHAAAQVMSRWHQHFVLLKRGIH